MMPDDLERDVSTEQRPTADERLMAYCFAIESRCETVEANVATTRSMCAQVRELATMLRHERRNRNPDFDGHGYLRQD